MIVYGCCLSFVRRSSVSSAVTWRQRALLHEGHRHSSGARPRAGVNTAVNTAVIAAGLSRAGLAAHSGVHGRAASYCPGRGVAARGCGERWASPLTRRAALRGRLPSTASPQLAGRRLALLVSYEGAAAAQ